jgi:hypothetical protein
MYLTLISDLSCRQQFGNVTTVVQCSSTSTLPSLITTSTNHHPRGSECQWILAGEVFCYPFTQFTFEGPRSPYWKVSMMLLATPTIGRGTGYKSDICRMRIVCLHSSDNSVSRYRDTLRPGGLGIDSPLFNKVQIRFRIYPAFYTIGKAAGA